jgi:hypothetical protein
MHKSAYSEQQLRELLAALDGVKAAHANVQKIGRKGPVLTLAEATGELIEASSRLLAVSMTLAARSCRMGE